MLRIETPADVKNHLGVPSQPSEWVTITQDMIDRFADVTGDHQWIHVDPARAAQALPGGKTIAHGYLLLSLLPHLSAKVSDVGNVRHALNYGSDKVRFLNQVPVGSRVRLRRTYKSADDTANGGVRVVSECVLEIEGQEKPALIAEVIAVLFP